MKKLMSALVALASLTVFTSALAAAAPASFVKTGKVITVTKTPQGGDQRTNIQAALDGALPGDVVQLSNEVFEVSGAPGRAYSLKLPASVMLEGPAVLLLAAGAPGGTTVLFLDGADSASVANLKIDGNRDTQSADVHRHGIVIQNSLGVQLAGVESSNNTGDGLWASTGTAHLQVSELSTSRNGHNGMTLGGSATDIVVKDSQFLGNSVQQFSTETGGPVFVSDVELAGCKFDPEDASQDFVLTIAGSGTNTRSLDWSVHDNIINGGVNVMLADAVQLYKNSGANLTAKPSVMVSRVCSDISIEGNTFKMVQETQDAVGVIYALGAAAGGVKQLRIKDNRLVTVSSRQQNGVRLEGIESAIVVGNDIRGSGLANNSAGIYLRATIPALPFKSAVIAGNYILNSGLAGITCQGNGTAELTQLVVTNNVFDNNGGRMTTATNLNADGQGAAKLVTLSGSVKLNGVQ